MRSWIFRENRVPYYQREFQKHDGLRTWEKVRSPYTTLHYNTLEESGGTWDSDTGIQDKMLTVRSTGPRQIHGPRIQGHAVQQLGR
jgi:hypothetical protein